MLIIAGGILIAFAVISAVRHLPAIALIVFLLYLLGSLS
jgi:hypothetical protein